MLETIPEVFPDARYQRCIVHQVRNTLKNVADKDRKPFANYLNTIYQVPSEEQALELLGSAYRKLNRQRSVFPSDTALLKTLYLGTFNAATKWTMPIRNWGQVYGELSIMYEERLPE